MKRLITIGLLPHFNVLAYPFSDKYPKLQGMGAGVVDTGQAHQKKMEPNSSSEVIR